MNDIVKELEVSVPSDRRVRVDLELPPDFPVGKAVLKLLIPRNVAVNNMSNVRGKGKGKVWMADDFDAPLEDFAEYGISRLW